jgi:hypothetical protein
MSDPFRHVKPGERFQPSARAWNTFADVAREARGHAHDSGGPPRHLAGRGLLRIKNGGGGDVDRFGVLAVSAPLFGIDGATFTPVDSFKNDFDLVGVTPDIDVHLGRFVIAAQPIASGAIGRVYSAGVCPVMLDVVHVEDRFADIADGVIANLKSGTSGAAQILWKEDDAETGVMWAVVRIGVHSIQHGPFAGVITAVDSGAKVYDARASHDPSITVADAAPLTRPFDVADVSVTLAEVGDPCTLMVKEDRTVVLWQVPELWGNEPACDA